MLNVPQHIPRRKKTFETLEKSIFTQTIPDHLEAPLGMSFHPFQTNFYDKYSMKPILQVFPVCCFTICIKTSKIIWMKM